MTKDLADELERLALQERFSIVDVGVFVQDNLLPILSALRGEEWEGIETHDGSNHPVLIYGNGIVGAARFREYMYRREWWWVGEGPGDAFAEPVRNPTHWMPFPPSPKGTTHE